MTRSAPTDSIWRSPVLPSVVHVVGGDGDVPFPRRLVVRLLENRIESPSVRSFVFSTAGTGFAYRSNQAIRLMLPGVDDPWGAARSLSLSSSPSEADRLTVTCRISETPFKQALARMGPGDEAVVFGPLGRFLYEADRDAVFVAGGIGITPFRGMLRFAADTNAPGQRRLLYTARVPEELVFRGELDAIARASPRTRVDYSVTRPEESRARWDGRVGRVDATWLREAADGLDRPRYYVVGLPSFVESVSAMLVDRLSVGADDLDYEVFRGF